jgi:hypothetical protein
MAALGLTLAEGQEGRRSIASGREPGHRFVAERLPVEKSRFFAAREWAGKAEPTRDAPMLMAIGRAEIVTSLVSYLLPWRFVALMEAGDIGKTTGALATTEALRAARCRGCKESLRC